MSLIDIVKYDGTPDVYAWKFPHQELGTWTQLIVNQSQEAILFKGGKALDSFGPGRHTLSTANIPLLNHIVNLPFGGKSPFTAEVWFVNKGSVLDIKWGTATPIQVKDPLYHILVPVRAFGHFGLTVEDSRKFLIKMVGTLGEFTKESLSKHIRGVMMMNITEIITSYLIHKKVSSLEINAYISEISSHAQAKIADVLDEFGIKIHHFYIENVSVPDGDPSIEKLRSLLNKRLEMEMVGFSYQQQRSLDILEGAAKNPGSVHPLFVGANLGSTLGGTFSGQMDRVSDAMNASPPPALAKCPHCGASGSAGVPFCSNCGKSMREKEPAALESPAKKVPHCDKCGTAIAENAKFCANCGDKYHACPSCGADTAEDSAKCHECGTALPKSCVSCNETILGGSAFCSHCGASQKQGG
ncbi:SPFH domain-containing protein [Paenibacillus sp. 1011MAR3C5]|uniref:SPFH domain-containing protein n=1 Tax=Paenibacillus sp. 1011MAR3C5 TaxID=1675787 RepID=UPI000E6CE5F3|nr:SPFH domain-containing protein [Paenibacillus sp. 1011MAR3C5]RJE87707.1 SPFH domain-containing protein [Paenibacillus sp. 1011MAR3C5]